ncbi:hypothetical protein GE061_020176 [Apolygus lucorum]|uniref:BTB domain-containing protein n=1 Tax=Apolygus lucorum TaxID=248454 RepID=A0A8S9WMG0_APOLU|nr:hypothetical protein GE061_020176 [Apolygus lucorum]
MSVIEHFPALQAEELKNRRLRMNEFRNQGHFTDVTLVIGDVQFAAHKLVLAGNSPVFEAMFNNDTLESQSGQVVITDVPSHVFSWFLECLYTEVLPPREETPLACLFDLFVCADKYQTTSLLLTLDREMLNRLKLDNAFDLFKIADTLGRAELFKMCLTYITENAVKIKDPKLLSDYFSSDKQLMVYAIEHLHKLVRKRHKVLPSLGSPSSSKYIDSTYSLKWTSLTENVRRFRPRGVKLSVFGRQVNFVVFFNDYFRSLNTKRSTSISMYPTTDIPRGVYIWYRVKVHCSKCNRFDINKDLLVWNERMAYSKLGHRRVELVRWDWGDLESTSVDLTVCAYDNENWPRNMVKTRVLEWVVDGKRPNGIAAEEHLVDSKDEVELIFGNYMTYVPRSAILKRMEPYSNEYWRYRTGDVVIESSETTGRAIVSYILTGLFPKVAKVDVPFMEAAWHLHLWHLVLYTEQALVWNLTPANVVEVACYGISNYHSWLVWASAQYLKFHLDRVTKTDEEWKKPAS